MDSASTAIIRKSSILLILCITMAAFIMCSCEPPVAYAGSLSERQHQVESLFDGPCAAYQIPKELALAIARQESGYHPWIINIAGRDVRPTSKEEGIRLAQKAIRAGLSCDIGLMQVNSYWLRRHGWTPEQVIEPQNNVRIGLWILAQEIQRHGFNWRAIASYHTPLHRNPARGRAYAQAIVAHVKNIMRHQ